jgi:hypothetical protein
MYKLIAFLLLAPALVLFLLKEQELHQASKSYFMVKQAIDRSILASAQQIDLATWAEGTPQLDNTTAEQSFLHYLYDNLTSVRQHLARVEVKSITIVDASQSFPYEYRGSAADPIMLRKPGIVVVCEVEYAKRWRILSPIVWTIQGAAQIVPHYPV